MSYERDAPFLVGQQLDILRRASGIETVRPNDVDVHGDAALGPIFASEQQMRCDLLGIVSALPNSDTVRRAVDDPDVSALCVAHEAGAAHFLDEHGLDGALYMGTLCSL